MTEHQIQAQIIKWFWNNHPEKRGMLFHVNNKARNSIEGNKFKALGVVSGVSDLILLKECGRTLLIEVKEATGRQSPAQIEWQAKVEKLGFEYHIVRTLEEFQKLC